MAEKIYYSMGEVAELLDVSPSLLRFWEKRFDIIAPHKNKKGNRLFSPEDVRNLKTIYHLVKERGMTLAGAEKLLKARRSEIERDVEIAERLGAIRALLVEVRNELGGGGTIVDDTVSEEVPGANADETGEENSTPAGPDAESADTGTDDSERAAEGYDQVAAGTDKAEESPRTPGFIEQTLF